MRRRILILVLLLLFGGSGYWLWHIQTQPTDQAFILYGNIETRELSLAFQDSGRVAEVMVTEGQRIEKGATVARLDTNRLELSISQSQAAVAAQKAAITKLLNGARPEEITTATANRDATAAEARSAAQTYERQRTLAAGKITSLQNLDIAKNAWDAAKARLASAEAAMNLAKAGPRAEDIAQAEAMLQADEAQLGLLQCQLAEATLKSPTAGIVQLRLLEPGEIATSQTPVALMALTDEKWARTYVSETDLIRIHPGMAAEIFVDGLPDRPFNGEITFISSVAEFTPKTIETADLRTSLVYEIRVRVQDPDNRLRLGSPVTVKPAIDPIEAGTNGK